MPKGVDYGVPGVALANLAYAQSTLQARKFQWVMLPTLPKSPMKADPPQAPNAEHASGSGLVSNMLLVKQVGTTTVLPTTGSSVGASLKMNSRTDTHRLSSFDIASLPTPYEQEANLESPVFSYRAYL